MLTHDQIAESQALVIQVFKQLRPELLSVFGAIEFTRKKDTSQVTEWDIRVEKTLSAALKEHDDKVGFQGEETGHAGNKDTYWLVDPIDGTSSFIRGLDFCTNMAALVHEGEVIAAVIYDFVNDIMYTAIKGEGALRNGVAMSVNQDRRAGNLIAYSFSSRTFGLVREALRELGVRSVLPVGAAGHFFVTLAEGKIDAVVSLGTLMGAYDIAPGMLIAEEAGAVVLSLDDKSGVERHEFIIGSAYIVDAIERSGLL